MIDGAAHAEGRRPKASRGGNRGGERAAVARALWGVECRGRGVRVAAGRLRARVGTDAVTERVVAAERCVDRQTRLP